MTEESQSDCVYRLFSAINVLESLYDYILAARCRPTLKKPQWLKVNIDEHCVVGWAQTFYI